jgi:hypothetical protein
MFKSQDFSPKALIPQEIVQLAKNQDFEKDARDFQIILKAAAKEEKKKGKCHKWLENVYKLVNFGRSAPVEPPPLNPFIDFCIVSD